MSEESSAARSTGVSFHVSSPASPQDIGGPASPSSGSTGAAYSAGAAPGTAVLPNLGSVLGPAWSPANQPLQLTDQQQQGHAGNSSTTNLLQLLSAYSSHHSAGGSIHSVGQSGAGAVQYAAGHGVSMGRSGSMAYEAAGDSFGQQGLSNSTPQQQLQILQHQQLQMLLARQQATGPQLLPPMQQAAAAAPQQLPVLLPMPLQVVLGAAQQRQQQPRRTLVPMSPGDAPKGSSTMLVLGSPPPKEASFEAGFEAGILQGIAQFTQQLHTSSLLSAGGPVTALSAVSAAPCVSGGLLAGAGSSLGLGLRPAMTGGPVLNPAGLGSVPPAAAGGSGGTPASRVLLQAQIAQQQSILQAALLQQQQAALQQQQQAALHQQVQQQAGALSRLGPKRGPAVRRVRKRRLHNERPSTSAECAPEIAVAEAARPSASPAPAEAPAAAHPPAAAAQTATAAAGTAAAAAAAPKLPSATSVAMCCSVSDLLGVSTREQAAVRLTSMNRLELFQFAAKALGLSCTSEQLSSAAASEQGRAAPPCCTPAEHAAGCCTPAERAAGCCTPAQMAAGCCAPAPPSSTDASLACSSSGSVQYCTPEQLVEGCCTADQVATGRCILMPAVDSDARVPLSTKGAPGGTHDLAHDLNRSSRWPVAHPTSQQLVEARCSPSAPPPKRSCVSFRPFAATAFGQAAAFAGNSMQAPHRSLPTHAGPAAAAEVAGTAVPIVQHASSHPGALQHSTGAAAAADAAANLEPLSYIEMYMDWQQEGAPMDWMV